MFGAVQLLLELLIKKKGSKLLVNTSGMWSLCNRKLINTTFSFYKQNLAEFLISEVPLFSTTSYDVVLLQELWMRPDHETIRSLLPAGYWMSSEVRELTAGH